MPRVRNATMPGVSKTAIAASWTHAGLAARARRFGASVEVRGAGLFFPRGEMRILVVGAGGVGGYFGGRLLAAGRDVTFLVRPARAERLANAGLQIRSPYGDVSIATVPTVLDQAIAGPYDLVLLSCKAYDLDSAMSAVAPAVGPDTIILPLLNGLRHLDQLDARFGAAQVLGGECKISAVLDENGCVLHLNRVHQITFGERSGVRSDRSVAIEAAISQSDFDVNRSDTVLQEMWEKWVLIATGAGATCLMRSTIGDIVSAGGTGMIEALLDECATIADENGHRPSEKSRQWIHSIFTTPGSSLTASMFRDIEANGRIEGDQIISDLIARGTQNAGAYPLLRTVQTHLRSYEARRARETALAT